MITSITFCSEAKRFKFSTGKTSDSIICNGVENICPDTELTSSWIYGLLKQKLGDSVKESKMLLYRDAILEILR